MENLAIVKTKCKKCQKEKYAYDYYIKSGTNEIGNTCKECILKVKKDAHRKKWGGSTGYKWGTLGNWAGS